MIERLNAALEGRYRIDRELGAGGMATVFLADDLRHDRKVALKVLKPELAAVVGAERFLAEIKTTANLQHPHILPLFDSGAADSFLFYVMPYVEGENLREKLDREKQLGVDEAVEIAEKVAGALHYAHGQDVVHRDIKPANILMNRGEPLVADFGIALALSEAGGGRITETGLSLGTPHYMSPEQASGDQSLDKRSDVYALGCILYEMLTGEPPYGGPTAQSVLAKILTGDAQRITQLRRTVPPNVDAAVAKALEKLPADRFTSAEAFVAALEDASFRHATRTAEAAPATSGGRRTGMPWGRVGVAGVMAVLGLAIGYLMRPAAEEDPMFVAAVGLGAEQGLMDIPFGPPMALSSDGTTLIYTGPAETSGWQLWVRRAGALQATPLAGTANGFTPTLAPNGGTVAFVQDASLKVLALGTGTVRTLADDAAFIADWTEGGYIYYLSSTSSDFNRIPAGGGERERVSGLSPDSDQGPVAVPLYTFGDVLPDGRTGVWTVVPVAANVSQLSVMWIDLETGEAREITPGFSPRYLASGHLVWASPEGTLVAAPFDPSTGELTGAPVQIVENVSRDGQGGAHAAYSETGDLVYRMGTSSAGEMQVSWVDRETGFATPVDSQWTVLPIAAGNWNGVSLSPDGTRLVATDGAGGGGQLWVKELETGTPPYRITFDGDFHVRPRWMPDGRSVSFISTLAGEAVPTQVWARAADGSGSARRLAGGPVEIEEAVVSPDGEWLVYRQGGTSTGRDIYALRLGQDTVGMPLVASSADEKSPQLSPDGRWLAYASNETGQLEVFIRPFPAVEDGRWQVSLGGGTSPAWANSGRELFYVGTADGISVMAARLAVRGSSVSVTGRERLFTVSNLYVDANYPAFDTDLSDERFIMFSFGGSEQGSLVWVRNWLTEWRQRAELAR